MSLLSGIPFDLLVALTYLTMLMVLVAAHELGHYLFARLFGMGAEEFSVGMFGRRPLAILGRRRYVLPVRPGEDPHLAGDAANVLEGGGATIPPEIETTSDGRSLLHETTLFTIRPWPIGGFVRIKGMVPQEDGGEIHIPGGFFSKSPLKRWVVLAAGPAFSVLAGILLLVPYLMFYGAPDPSGAPVIGALVTSGAAYRVGLDVGDRVVSVDGAPISTFYDMAVHIRDTGGRPLAIVVDRDGRRITKVVRGDVGKEPTAVRDRKGRPTGVHRIQTTLGAYAATTPKPLSFRDAVGVAVRLPVEGALGLMEKIAHPSELAENVGGPGTMIQMTARSVREGLWPVIERAAEISISLGIFNLLPIPPLDGGQMWIAFVEMLRRGRRLSMQTQIRVLNVGFALVGALVLCVLAIDFGRLTGLSAPPKITDQKR